MPDTCRARYRAIPSHTEPLVHVSGISQTPSEAIITGKKRQNGFSGPTRQEAPVRNHYFEWLGLHTLRYQIPHLMSLDSVTDQLFLH